MPADMCGDKSTVEKQNEATLQKLISQNSVHKMGFPTATRTTANSEVKTEHILHYLTE